MIIFSSRCYAHPHSFITLETDFVTDKHKLVGVKFAWTMDEMTSSYLKYEYKREPKKVFNEFMINVFENHFFSEFWLKASPNNQLIQLMPQEQGAKLDVDSPKVVAYFEAKLKEPIELADHEFELMTYEKTFYVDMYYDTDKQIHINDLNCKITLNKPSPDDSTINYASSLDKNDAPTQTDDFVLGKLFAQKVIVKCQ